MNEKTQRTIIGILTFIIAGLCCMIILEINNPSTANVHSLEIEIHTLDVKVDTLRILSDTNNLTLFNTSLYSGKILIKENVYGARLLSTKEIIISENLLGRIK